MRQTAVCSSTAAAAAVRPAAALLVDELATDADLVDDNGSRPRLRHHPATFGTNLVRVGTDLAVVAELMGHHPLETDQAVHPAHR